MIRRPLDPPSSRSLPAPVDTTRNVMASVRSIWQAEEGRFAIPNYHLPEKPAPVKKSST